MSERKVKEDIMDIEHDLVMVDEFDALSIELKVPKKEGQPIPPSASPTDKEQLRFKQKRNDAWLRENLGRFPAKTHVRKAAKELDVQTGYIYLPGQEEKLYEDSDMGPEFRQRRHFYYITGADFPGCAVTYDIARDHLVLWVPYTDPRTVLWYGRTPTFEQCKAASDVDEVRYIAGLGRFLCASLYPGCTMYVLHPDQTPKLENTKGIVRIDTHKLAPAIERARVVKTDYEIAMIRRANAVSSAAHKAVLTRLKKLTNEREMDAIFKGFCLAQGAKHQSYAVIAASGANASTLHYCDNDQSLAGRQLALLDAGAEWNCYASDITRTFPISGKFSPEAASIYAIVERMQNECIQRVRPGVVFSALHLHACVVAITELMKLGILHGGTPSEIFKRGTVAAFFPHGLGHHVGLEVHDVSGRNRLLMSSSPLPNYSMTGYSNGPRCSGKVPPKREWVSPEMVGVMYRNMGALTPVPGAIPDLYSGDGRQILEKNMVVTIEPGIYFCREYIKAYFLDNELHAKYINKKVLDKYWDVGGVRIEDDILVTEGGYENLTVAPKGEEMLKIINAGGGDSC